MLSLLKRPASVGSNRERLRHAITARDAAQQAVIEARATLERLETVVKVGDDAARAAADERRAATEARNAWVRSGCSYSAARELQSLEDSAAEAGRVAERAALDTAAVCKELARAQDAVQSRQNDIRHCEAEISIAVGVILAEEAAP
ncbi:MAG: hypothetical protein ACLQKH_13760, partial [Steroidobacteraceae bacterium]